MIAQIKAFFNPTVLLAFVVSLGVGAAAGGYAGWDYRGAKEAETRLQGIEAAVQAIQEKAKEDEKLAVSQAVRETEAKNRATNAKLKGDADAARKASAQCNRDAESVRLLYDQIDAANGRTPKATVVPDGVSGHTETDRWLGPLNPTLGKRTGEVVGGMPTSPP